MFLKLIDIFGGLLVFTTVEAVKPANLVEVVVFVMAIISRLLTRKHLCKLIMTHALIVTICWPMINNIQLLF